MLGGGMRQAGILAAAGIYALENNVDRLAEDHANATLLAEGIADVEQLEVEPKSVQTNMVFVWAEKMYGQLKKFLKGRSVLIQGGPSFRLVTHLDVTEEDIHTVVATIKEFFSRVER
jgi:threonine aldolase